MHQNFISFNGWMIFSLMDLRKRRQKQEGLNVLESHWLEAGVEDFQKLRDKYLFLGKQTRKREQL